MSYTFRNPSTDELRVFRGDIDTTIVQSQYNALKKISNTISDDSYRKTYGSQTTAIFRLKKIK